MRLQIFHGHRLLKFSTSSLPYLDRTKGKQYSKRYRLKAIQENMCVWGHLDTKRQNENTNSQVNDSNQLSVNRKRRKSTSSSEERPAAPVKGDTAAAWGKHLDKQVYLETGNCKLIVPPVEVVRIRKHSTSRTSRSSPSQVKKSNMYWKWEFLINLSNLKSSLCLFIGFFGSFRFCNKTKQRNRLWNRYIIVLDDSAELCSASGLEWVRSMT